MRSSLKIASSVIVRDITQGSANGTDTAVTRQP